MATTINRAASASDRIVRSRAVGVAGGVLGAVVVWTVAVPLLGNHLFIRFGTGAAQGIGLDYVIGMSLGASLVGWALLAVLERRTAAARTIWTGIAVVVALVSLSLPFIAGTTTATKVTLALMHVAVAAVVIPALTRGSSARRTS